MANEKNPSLYYDRSTIGSSEELDEYGVWVKSEPQDFSSVVTAGHSETLDAGSTPDEAELPDFDDFAIDDLGFDDLTPFQDDSPEQDTAGFGADNEFALSVEDTESLFEEFNTETEIPGDGEDGFAEVSMEDFLDGLPAVIEETGTLDETAVVNAAEAPRKAAAPGADAAASVSVETPDSPETSGSTETHGSQETHYSSEMHDYERSTQLLMKIADELASIKAEISGLKNELANVRGESREGPG